MGAERRKAMDLQLAGRTALVTGGSKGLGRYSALALAEEGCHVAICARGREDLDRTVVDLKNLGVKAVGIQADVTTEEGTTNTFQETVSVLGPVDVLVNNAGAAVGEGFDSTDDSTWEESFQYNLYSGIRLTRLALPHMKEQGWGRIINISSIWGRESGGPISYLTAKAALNAVSKGLAMELAGSGITVNTVAPGSITFEGGGWQEFIDNEPKEVVADFIANNLPMGRFGWPRASRSISGLLGLRESRPDDWYMH